MTENEYLEMPWSIEDTIENLNEIKENFKVILINKNLDGKASDDVKELEFDFDRAINALEKQIPKKPVNYDKHYYKCPCCNKDLEIDNDMLFVYDEEPPKFCIKCGQKLDWSDESEQ